MKKNVGLWIDHRTAHVVFATDNNENKIKLIESNVEKHEKHYDENKANVPFPAGLVPPDDLRDRKFAQHLNVYYDEIISIIKDAKSIFIFGPGEAKIEFKKRLETKHPGQYTIFVEPADKMTDHQIIAKVQKHFSI